MSDQQTAESAAPSERDPRLCSHPGKEGTGCKAYAVKGDGLCAGHLGRGVAASADVAREAQRLSVKGRQEQAKVARSAVQVYREGIERDAEEFYKVRLACVRDDAAPWASRLAAMEQLENRALGRTKESVEHSFSDLERVQGLSGEEREELRDRLEQRRERLSLVL